MRRYSFVAASHGSTINHAASESQILDSLFAFLSHSGFFNCSTYFSPSPKLVPPKISEPVDNALASKLIDFTLNPKILASNEVEIKILEGRQQVGNAYVRCSDTSGFLKFDLNTPDSFVHVSQDSRSDPKGEGLVNNVLPATSLPADRFAMASGFNLDDLCAASSNGKPSVNLKAFTQAVYTAVHWAAASQVVRSVTIGHVVKLGSPNP